MGHQTGPGARVGPFHGLADQQPADDRCENEQGGEDEVDGDLQGPDHLPGPSAANLRTAAAKRRATMFNARTASTADALASYGANDAEIARQAARLIDKMVRRHPHVFGNAAIGTAREALAQWEAIKQREADDRGQRRSVLDGVPRALPALLRAQRVQAKAARVNFDWPNARAAWLKVEEEIREAAEAIAAGDTRRVGEELGDVLFTLVNVARLSSLDAEDVLHGAIEKFRRRFTDMEAELVARGTSVSTVAPDELERSWEAAKAQERRETRP